jgi:hypothetical protein
MANFLQSVLVINKPLFNAGLAALEKSTGNSGIDTRLIADILEKAHKVMRVIGLDTHDTTGHELYTALLAASKRDNLGSLITETDYVLLLIDGQIISFNLIDIIENSHHELPFGNQIVSHGQRGLRGEIIGRYIDHARTDESIVLEIIDSMGLILERDAWYNKHKQKANRSKESVK